MIEDSDRIDIEIRTDRRSHRFYLYCVALATETNTDSETKVVKIFNLMNTFQRLHTRLFGYSSSGATQ